MKKINLKSLSVRLPLLFAVSMIAILGVMIPLVYQRFYNRMIDQYTRMGKGVTELMVNAFDGDKVEEYIKENYSNREYMDTVNYLTTLRDNYPDILYMYVYRFEEDGGHVIIDLDADWWENGAGYEPGYVWGLDELEEPFKSNLSKVMQGNEIAGYSELTKEDGYLFTYTRPIFRSDGSYACTACVDFSLNNLRGTDIAFTWWLTIILAGIGGLVLILDIYIVRKRITDPIDELSGCAGRFAYSTEEDRKNNIKLLDALDIHTGDEIEDVYHVLQSVTRDSLMATENLLNAQLDIKDRDGMITAMAADYRSIYYVSLDKDEAVCYRNNGITPYDMWEGRTFPFYQSFVGYARRHIVEEDREGFVRFINPDNIREGLSHEPMISYRYLAEINGVEQYEMLRIAGVRTIEQRDDHIVHAIGAGFSNVDQQMREEMENNRALTEALARAEEANAAKTAFLSSMSHEIRTPMNAIIGLDNIALRDTDIPQHTRDELEKIGASARHLLALINDILDMSRIESGRMVLKEEEFSFKEVIDQINVIVGGQCEDKKLIYDSRVIGSIDAYFIGDALRLRQIIINILGNAVKFTDPPGTITFTVEQTDYDDDKRLLHFTMKDTGIGMDEDFLPRLFDAFAQEDATNTNRYGGSGLGMAITKNMVDLMGGRILVESKKGEGTTFMVEIPIHRAFHVDKPIEEEQNVSIQDISLEGLHVLVADDIELNAEILIDLLEIEDISSEWAENGQKALDLFAGSEEGHFDAILMDMRMPVMDGLESTRAIRKLDRKDAAEIPIIALTANAFEEDVKRCLEAGMDAHLSKPVDIDQLKEVLGKILRAHK